MLQRLSPCTNFDCDKHLLAKVMFTSDDKGIADEIGVSIKKWQAWKTGKEPVPKLVYLYLVQKRKLASIGKWEPLIIDNERLKLPWGENINMAELVNVREYRRAADVATRQADLIEKLMAERDFYRENCLRQAKYGLMLNRLFR